MRSVMMGVGFGLAVCAGSAIAGPPVGRHIDPGANWVVHFDLNSIDETEIGGFFMDLLDQETEDFAEIRESMPNFWPGPEGGMFGITMYGSSLDMEGDDVPDGFTAIIYGDDQIAGWGSMLEAIALHEGFEDEIKTREVHGYDVWSVPMDGGGRVYAGKVEKGDNVAWVIAFDSSRIRDSLLMFSDGGGTDLLPRDGWREGTIAYLSTSTLDGIDLDEASIVIGEAKSVRMRIGEDAGEVYLQAALDLGDEERADKIRSIVHGLIAIGQFVAAEDEELAMVMEAVRGREVGASGGRVLFDLTNDAGDVIEFLEEAIEADEDDTDDYMYDEDDEDDGDW